MIFDERRNSIITQFERLETIRKYQKTIQEKRDAVKSKAGGRKSPDKNEAYLTDKAIPSTSFLTQQEDNDDLDPIDAILARLNMDMKNRVTEFEKFMMTDPDEDTWEENIKKAKENLKMQNFETAKVYPTSIM